jgi:hypothetical protein
LPYCEADQILIYYKMSFNSILSWDCLNLFPMEIVLNSQPTHVSTSAARSTLPTLAQRTCSLLRAAPVRLLSALLLLCALLAAIARVISSTGCASDFDNSGDQPDLRRGRQCRCPLSGRLRRAFQSRDNHYCIVRLVASIHLGHRQRLVQHKRHCALQYCRARTILSRAAELCRPEWCCAAAPRCHQ